MKKVIKKLLQKAGVEIVRYPDKDLTRRLKLLKKFKINLVFDVGANVGSYAINLFDNGYKGKIVSVEPLSAAYKSLLQTSIKYNNWETINAAIGNIDGEIEINVSENLYSSSILEMMPAHSTNAPNSRYINKEKVPICKLDSIYYKYIRKEDCIFLKIDTQGYEENVLEGAEEFLSRITGIQLEMSLIPMYSNSMLFAEMIAYLKSKGFKLYSVENGFSSQETGQLFQMDGIFFKEDI